MYILKKNNLIIILIFVFITFISFIKSYNNNNNNNNNNDQNNAFFSGFYRSDYRKTGAAEDFAASWLISSKRFNESKKRLSGSSNMAGVSFAITREKCKNCVTIMSRDYMDFLVEHLSTTSNQIPHSDKQVFDVYKNRMKVISEHWKNISYDRIEKDVRLDQTIALLIYSSISFSRPRVIPSQKYHISIRKYFFEATFWSVHKYFPNVLVFIASDQDREEINAMHLPIWSGNPIQLQVPLDPKNRTILLPRLSLEYGIHHINTNPDWAIFKYVYYSEGDQILHLRSASEFFNVIDQSGGSFAIVPHRMQTLPLAQSIPKVYLKKFKKHPHINLHDAVIITLQHDEQDASCCDHGRLVVAQCGEWWYQCPDWGLKNVNPWLQFGKDGFTTPSATAHKGVCTFSPIKQLCPKPANCKYHTPKSKSKKRKYTNIRDVCNEFQIKTFIGPNSTSFI